MTRTDFDRIIHAYGGQQPPPGLWPHSPLTTREIPLWFARLKRYDVERVLAALDELSMQDRRNAPSVSAVIETLRAHAPHDVPVPDWQHALARANKVTLTQLFQAARPLHAADSALAQCYREISDHAWHLRGQEAAFITACERFAALYPADADFWQEQIIQKRREMRTQSPAPRPLPSQACPGPRSRIGSFTHLGALLPKRRDRV